MKVVRDCFPVGRHKETEAIFDKWPIIIAVLASVAKIWFKPFETTPVNTVIVKLPYKNTVVNGVKGFFWDQWRLQQGHWGPFIFYKHGGAGGAGGIWLIATTKLYDPPSMQFFSTCPPPPPPSRNYFFLMTPPPAQRETNHTLLR